MRLQRRFYAIAARKHRKSLKRIYKVTNLCNFSTPLPQCLARTSYDSAKTHPFRARTSHDFLIPHPCRARMACDAVKMHLCRAHTSYDFAQTHLNGARTSYVLAQTHLLRVHRSSQLRSSNVGAFYFLVHTRPIRKDALD